MESQARLKDLASGTSSRTSARSQVSQRTSSSGLFSVSGRTSAFSRIYSIKNIRAQHLPRFLRNSSKGLKPADLHLLTLLSTKPDVKASFISSEEERSYSTLRVSSEKVQQVKDIERLMAGAEGVDLKNGVLKVRSRSLRPEDLVCFREGRDFPDVLVDAYMSVLKHLTRNKTQKILISNAAFSRAIFLEGKSYEISIHKNILAYDWLLFPLKTSNWALLAVDMKERLVYFYDPVKDHSQINRLLSELFAFLRAFILQTENKQLEATEWRDLYYKFLKNPKFEPRDSGAFICKQAETIFKNKRRKLDPAQVKTYRQEILISLMKASLYNAS